MSDALTSNPKCVHSPYAADNTLIVESHWSANTRIRCTVCGGCAYVSKKGAVEPETCDCHRAAPETSARLSDEDETRIGRVQAELAVLKKDARTYDTRRIAGQALEVITLLKARRSSVETSGPLGGLMECSAGKVTEPPIKGDPEVGRLLVEAVMAPEGAPAPRPVQTEECPVCHTVHDKPLCPAPNGFGDQT